MAFFVAMRSTGVRMRERLDGIDALIREIADESQFGRAA
jgi:hypothetical protein